MNEVLFVVVLMLIGSDAVAHSVVLLLQRRLVGGDDDDYNAPIITGGESSVRSFVLRSVPLPESA